MKVITFVFRIFYNVGRRIEISERIKETVIRCALAAGNVSATLGFVVSGKAKPMTLSKGRRTKTQK